LAVAAVEKGFAVSLLDELGLSRLRDLADDPLGNARRISAALERALRKATLAQWERRLRDKDFCVTGVYDLKEAAGLIERLQGACPASTRSRTRAKRRSVPGTTKGRPNGA